MGERCRAFERAFAGYLGVEHAVMVNSGSSANLIALFALADPLLAADGARPRRIERGSEVIVPALTWSTTIWPVLQAGAKPVFVDCDPGTLQVKPETIEAAITEATSAIVVVHVLGGAVDVARVAEIARRRNWRLFEDTCESLGVAWDGKAVGSFGQLASFSFYFSHHITTIEGGMVVTNDARLADLLRALRAHGWVRDLLQGAEIAAGHPDSIRAFCSSPPASTFGRPSSMRRSASSSSSGSRASTPAAARSRAASTPASRRSRRPAI